MCLCTPPSLVSVKEARTLSKEDDNTHGSVLCYIDKCWEFQRSSLNMRFVLSAVNVSVVAVDKGRVVPTISYILLFIHTYMFVELYVWISFHSSTGTISVHWVEVLGLTSCAMSTAVFVNLCPTHRLVWIFASLLSKKLNDLKGRDVLSCSVNKV